jgi:hypothetical protein
MTSFKMMGAGPSVLARVRDAAEGRGQAEGRARLLKDFLIDLRMEIGSIKSDCFCGVTPVVGASLAKLADYSSQLDDFFDRVGKDPEGFMREREAKRQALLPKNRHLAAQAAKAETARIDAEAIYRSRAEQAGQGLAESSATRPTDPFSQEFADAIYATRAKLPGDATDA